MNVRSSYQFYIESQKKRDAAGERYQAAHRMLRENPAGFDAKAEQNLFEALNLLAAISNPADELLAMQCWHDLVINALKQRGNQTAARHHMQRALSCYYQNRDLFHANAEYFICAASMVTSYVSAIIHASSQSKNQMNKHEYDDLVMLSETAADILQGLRDYKNPANCTAEIRGNLANLCGKLMCIYHELRKDNEKFSTGRSALQALLNAQDKCETDMDAIASIYEKFSRIYQNDPSYIPLFDFMHAYFSGSHDVSMSGFKQIVEKVNAIEYSGNHAAMLMQFMRLVVATCNHASLPDTTFKRELSGHYYLTVFKQLFDLQVKKEDKFLDAAVKDTLALLDESKHPVVPAKAASKVRATVEKKTVVASSMFPARKVGGGRVAALTRQLEPVLRFDKK